MDKYFLAIIVLIVFSILTIFYVKIFGKDSDSLEKTALSEDGSDFTILE